MKFGEQSVPDNYLISEKHELITLVPNKLGIVQFQNYPKPGLTVNKIDSVTGNPIKGAKFHVTYASNDTFSGEINDLGYYYPMKKASSVSARFRTAGTVSKRWNLLGLRHQGPRNPGVLHQGRHSKDTDL